MLNARRSTIAIAVLTAALVGTIAVENNRVRSAQEHEGKLALRNDSAAAAVDTTHAVMLERPAIAAVLGDSLRMSERRVVQATFKRDSVARILGLEQKANYVLWAKVDSLHRVVSAVTREDSSSRVRRASFNVRQTPYTLVANVELPTPPDTGRMDASIALDPIPLVARLSCAPPNPDGIRAASIETTSPKWASVNFTSVQQTPDLCRSPALDAKPGARLRPAIIIGGGLISRSTAEVQLGVFAGIGFAYGR